MARGRRKGAVSLKETVHDSEIIRLGEVRCEPNYIMPDGEYGISGGYRDYSLVKKRLAYRTGTDEDGVNCGKVIEYTTWEDVPCYHSTLEGIFTAYAKILNLTEFKKKKMCKETSEIVNIYNNTLGVINNALGGIDKYLDRKQVDVCSLADVKEQLISEINDLKKIKNNLQNNIDDITRMHNEIKEKHKIIINVEKPKRHKTKEETE